MASIKLFPQIDKVIDTGFDPDTLNPDLTLKDINDGNKLQPVDIISGEHEFGDTSFDLSSQFIIEVINESNPKEVLEFVEDKPFERKENKKYEWSWEKGSGNAAISYQLTGTGKGKFDSGKLPIAAGTSLSVGVEGNTSLKTSFIRVHKEDAKLFDSIVYDLVTSDPKRYQFPLLPREIHKLEPETEFLLTEFSGGLGFTATVTWGEMFRSNPSLTRKILPGGKFSSILDGKPLLKGDAGAKATIGATISGRMELIAFMKGKDVARIEFRRASSGSISAAGELTVTANILDKVTSKEILNTLIKELSEPITDAFAKTDKWIELLEKNLLEWRKALDPTVIFAGADSYIADAVATLNNALSIDLSSLVAFQSRFGKIFEKSNEYIDLLEISEGSLLELWTKLDNKIDELVVDLLPEEHRDLAQSILDTLGIELGPLESLLSLQSYRDEIMEKVGNANTDNLDLLRENIIRVINQLGLEEILTKKEINLLKLLEESTGVNIATIFSISSLGTLLADKLGIDIPSLDSLLKKLLETVTGIEPNSELAELLKDFIDPAGGVPNLPKTKEILAEIAKWFDIDFVQIPEKLDEILEGIATGISQELELAASLEITRTKESEAFFQCEFEGVDEPGASRDLCNSVYEKCLKGDLDDILSIYRDQSELFGNLKFFTATKKTKKLSIISRFLFAESDEKPISSKMRATNEDGLVLEAYDEVSNSSAKDTFLKIFSWPPKRVLKYEYKAITSVQSRTRDFVPATSLTARNFDTDFSSSISWGGKVVQQGPPFVGVTEKVESINREMLLLFARLLDSNPKFELTGSTLESRIQSEFESAKTEDELDLRIHLDASGEAAKYILEDLLPADWNSNSKLVKSQKLVWDGTPAWRGLKKQVPAGTYDDNDYKRERNNYFDAFSELTESVRSDVSSEEFYEKMISWQKQYHLRSGAAWRHENFAYTLSILISLPAELPGWSVSASLKKNSTQMILA